MANLCNNSVVFTGDPIDLENVKALFKEIRDKQETTCEWFLPPYVTADFSKMQHITLEGEKINYDTRWFPNLAALRKSPIIITWVSSPSMMNLPMAFSAMPVTRRANFMITG